MCQPNKLDNKQFLTSLTKWSVSSGQQTVAKDDDDFWFEFELRSLHNDELLPATLATPF